MVKVIGTILIAMGVTFATAVGIDVASQHYYNRATITAKQEIVQISETLTQEDTQITVSNDLWQDVLTYAQDTYDVGEYELNIDYHTITFDENKYPLNLGSQVFSPLTDIAYTTGLTSITLGTDTYTIETYTLYGTPYARVKKNGTQIYEKNYVSPLYPISFLFIATGSSGQASLQLSIEYNSSNGDNLLQRKYVENLGDVTDFSEIAIAYGEGATTIPYTRCRCTNKSNMGFTKL